MRKILLLGAAALVVAAPAALAAAAAPSGAGSAAAPAPSWEASSGPVPLAPSPTPAPAGLSAAAAGYARAAAAAFLTAPGPASAVQAGAAQVLAQLYGPTDAVPPVEAIGGPDRQLLVVRVDGPVDNGAARVAPGDVLPPSRAAVIVLDAVTGAQVGVTLVPVGMPADTLTLARVGPPVALVVGTADISAAHR